MTIEEALATLTAILGKESLNDLQEIVFRLSWERKSYPEIAERSGYDDGYVKYVGFQLWKMLSVALGERVSKNNVRSVLSKWRSHKGREGEEKKGREGGTTRILNTDTQMKKDNLLYPCIRAIRVVRIPRLKAKLYRVVVKIGGKRSNTPPLFLLRVN